MRFTIEPELELFAESVRGALAGWEAPVEPVFGEWQDDRDDALAARLAEIGWGELWSDPDLLGPAVAGGIELGTGLSRPCASSTRRRSARRSRSVGACGTARGGSKGESESRRSTARARCAGSRRLRICRPTLRGSTRGVPSRSRTWRASPTARSRRRSSMRSRGSSSARRLPRCRRCRRTSRMRPWPATACCCRRGRPPTRRRASRATRSPGRERACREVTAHVQQVHGGIGFALEGGIHRYYRRAKTVQVWTDALLRELG